MVARARASADFCPVAARRGCPIRLWSNRCSPLFPARASRLDNRTDAIVKPASRRGPVDVSRRARQRSRRSGGAVDAHSIVRRLLVTSLAPAIFLIAFMCDTEAMARLLWAYLAGHVAG